MVHPRRAGFPFFIPWLIKLTYIIDNLEVGGAQVHLTRLVKGIHAGPSHDIEIVSLGSVSPLIREKIPGRVPIVSLNMDSARQPVFYVSFVRLVRHLMRRRPDIVHTYLNTSNVFGIVAALIASVGRIVTSRRDMGQFRTDRIGTLERVLSRRFAARVFCVCNAVAERALRIERLPEEKIRVLFNGIDTGVFKGREEYRLAAPLTFGMVANMDRVEKGHREFIEAASWVSRRSGGQARFLLAGDGPLRTRLEELALGLRVSNSVEFLGEQQDIGSFLDNVDVLVVPSYSEGISNAMLEAMAKGLPVIATAVDGNLETVQNGHTGILVPAREPRVLAEAILIYSGDPVLAEAHGRNGRRRAEDLFSIDTMLEAYRREYRALVEGG